MTGRLDGKVAIITGAARGQGEAAARMFVREGARVAIADIDDAEGQAVAADLGEAARYLHLDVSRADQWEQTVDATIEAFGKVDVLVNNAGVARFSPIDVMAEEEFLAHVNVNMLGPFLGIKAVFSAMRAAGGGSIVNIGSTNSFRGSAGGAAYTSTKFGLNGLTQSSAVELGPFGVRVNLVAPGGVLTKMAREAQAVWYGEDVMESSPNDWALPINRMAEPSEIASMVLFLASDEASYCTGAQFIVDGGMNADHPFKPSMGWLKHRRELEAQQSK